jgi:5-methylcytosine-specific restriction endonuclease McrA
MIKACRQCARLKCDCSTKPRSGSTRSWRKLRVQAIAIAPRRDGLLVCGICNRTIPADQTPDVDHYVPLHFGGTDELDNLRVAHRHCNRGWRKQGG